MDKAGFAYEKLIAEENVSLCARYGISSAPTLVLTDGEDFTCYRGVSEIKQAVLAAKQVG